MLTRPMYRLSSPDSLAIAPTMFFIFTLCLCPTSKRKHSKHCPHDAPYLDALTWSKGGAYSIGRLGNTNLIIASVCNSIVSNYSMIWD